MVNTLRRSPPHFILGVNTLFSALIQHPEFRRLDFSQLKATIGGGMAILPSVAKKWHTITGLPIIEGYGLSETAPVITFNPLTIAEFTNKVGLPTPATDIILLDNNDQPVRIGERGEIAVKGPQVMVGYRTYRLRLLMRLPRQAICARAILASLMSAVLSKSLTVKKT